MNHDRYRIKKIGGWWLVTNISVPGIEIRVGCSSSWDGARDLLCRWTGRS